MLAQDPRANDTAGLAKTEQALQALEAQGYGVVRLR